MSLSTTLTKTIDAIRGFPNVHVRTHRINPPAPDPVLASMEGHVSEGIISLYREMNGVEFEWFFEDLSKHYHPNVEASLLGGRIYLFPFGVDSEVVRTERDLGEGETSPQNQLLDHGWASMPLDLPVSECFVYWVHPLDGGADDGFITAFPAAGQAESVAEPTERFDSYQTYLLVGQSLGFNWYWPLDHDDLDQVDEPSFVTRARVLHLLEPNEELDERVRKLARTELRRYRDDARYDELAELVEVS